MTCRRKLMADVAANMIGRGNARRAARRVFGVLQDKRLNQQLMLCILDEVCVGVSHVEGSAYPVDSGRNVSAATQGRTKPAVGNPAYP